MLEARKFDRLHAFIIRTFVEHGLVSHLTSIIQASASDLARTGVGRVN